MDPVGTHPDPLGERDSAEVTTRHARLAELFRLVRDLAPDERTRALRVHAGEDATMRREVEHLVAFHERDSPVDRSIVPAGIDDAITPISHDAVPGYRLLRVLGEGGMGVVYLAEQERPKRRVALKLLRLSAIDPTTLQRFEREAEVLARLRHPGIATLFEAGTAPLMPGAARRRPWFAMEFIDGTAIHLHVRDKALQPREIVRLLMRVCEAVNHAHINGVVHRDLKPWNILVERTSEGARPKVLDFGVARILDDGSDRTLHTESGQIVGTLHWMGPEQLDGTAAVTARADVYALGVILFELLTGRQPIVLAGLPLTEALRRVKQSEPTRLSRLRPELGRDLEAVLATAMEKDPARRYADAGELGGDLRRWLEDAPVTARRQHALERLRRFARRNRGVVAITLLVVLLLSLGLAGTLTSLVAAKRDADRLRRVLDGVESVLIAADPLSPLDPHAGTAPLTRKEMTLFEALERAADKLPASVRDQPDVEGDFRAMLGRAFAHMGRLDEAERELRRSYELRKSTLGVRAIRTADIGNRLAIILARRGRGEEALAILSETEHADIGAGMTEIHTLTGLGVSFHSAGNSEAAVLLFDRALAAARAIPDLEDPALLPAVLHAAAQARVVAGQLDEAEPLALEAVDRWTALDGPDGRETFSAMNTLGVLRRKQGRLEEAEAILGKNARRAEEVLTRDDWYTAALAHAWGRSLLQLNRLAEAEPLLRDAFERLSAKRGLEAQHTRVAAASLAELLESTDRAEEAASFRAIAGDAKP